MMGFSGFTVNRQVHLNFGRKINFWSYTFKMAIVCGYFGYQLYINKGYLKFGHTDGISRLQLQHPVSNHCNPIDPDGCASNFTDAEDLLYCKQSKRESGTIHQEHCEYLDEYDLKLPGYQQNQLLLPTRRTKFVQNVDCKGKKGPCPRKDHFAEAETTYVADIEDFTLLIDHSMVNDELNIEMRAWDMIGFHNPCGVGKVLSSSIVNEAAGKFRSMLTGRDAPIVHNATHCHFMPIHRPKKEKESAYTAARERGYAMWMSGWHHTLLPHVYEADPKVLAYKDPSPFFKIKNGDVIRIGDLLDMLGPAAAMDTYRDGATGTKNNRYEGFVVVIEVLYSNWRIFTWPNWVDPAYFYSVSLAPASEYKLMMDSSRQAVNAKENTEAKRVVYDYHGIFIVLKQRGDMGCLSLWRIFLLFLGALFIETVYRSIFLLFILNCGNCSHDIFKNNKVGDDGEAAELGKTDKKELHASIMHEYFLGDNREEFIHLTNSPSKELPGAGMSAGYCPVSPTSQH